MKMKQGTSKLIYEAKYSRMIYYVHCLLNASIDHVGSARIILFLTNVLFMHLGNPAVLK